MAKALLGHVATGRVPAQYVSENARLRARVTDLELLVARLQQENDRLSSLHAADLDDEIAAELAVGLSHH